MASSSADHPSIKKSRKTENQADGRRREATDASRAVTACLRMKGISNAALRQIANKLCQENITKHFIENSSRARFGELTRDIMLPMVTGGERRWPVADPSTLVAISIRDSPQMEEVFAGSLQVHPFSDYRP